MMLISQATELTTRSTRGCSPRWSTCSADCVDSPPPRNSILFAPLTHRYSMTLADDTQAAVDEAAAAIAAGEAVVYPTETVYGLGADATASAAVDRVFEIKDRPRDKPLSVAFADRDHARQYTEPTDRELEFIDRFLPGPVTVVVDREPSLPDNLTHGLPRV